MTAQEKRKKARAEKFPHAFKIESEKLDKKGGVKNDTLEARRKEEYAQNYGGQQGKLLRNLWARLDAQNDK